MIAFKTLFTTFYSYKGGVGRTSALVNSALLRAISGDRVVVLDFDLEAPGVTSYVNEIAQKNNKSVDLDTRPGILDYLYDAIEHKKITDLRKYAVTNEDLGLEMEGSIWFVGAGNTADPNYSTKLSSIDWDKIFREKHGAMLLENLKRQIESEFEGPDYVFIDSRTGITETGGVCTKYLADIVVVLTSLNEQNIIGTSRVYDAFKKSKIPTILVASNVPVGLPWDNNQLFTSRIDNFKNAFKCPPDLLIYHYPSLSLVEYLPAWFKYEDKSSILKEDPLLKSYETLANKIASKNESRFDKFLNEMLYRSGMLLNEHRQMQLKESLVFFKKHYSNRKCTYDLIKNLDGLKKSIDKSSENKIDKDFMSLFKKVKKTKCGHHYSNLYFTRRMLLDKASELLVYYFRKHKDEIKKPFDWYHLIGSIYKFDAIGLLIFNKEFKFVYEVLSDDDIGGYVSFAKAYAAEKLNIPEANKYYNLFLTDLHNDYMDSASASFACSYAALKLNKFEMAKTCFEKAMELIDKSGEERYFVPTEFAKTTSKSDFKKELIRYGKSLKEKSTD